MSGNVGRLAKLKKGGSVLAGVRTKSISWGGESVDVSSSEDGGVRLLLSASGQEQIEIPIEGITKDDTLLKISLDTTSDKMLTDITLDFDIRNPINITPATLSGNFRLSGYEEGMPYNDAITFSATLESSDGWNYTAEGSTLEYTVEITHGNDTALTDYQVRVMLNVDNFDFDVTATDGSEISFSDSSDSALDFSLVSYDYASKLGVFDVLIPSLSATDSIKLIYDGSGGASSPSDTYDYYSALDDLTGFTTTGGAWSVVTDATMGSVFEYAESGGTDGAAYQTASVPSEYRAYFKTNQFTASRNGFGGVMVAMTDDDDWVRAGYKPDSSDTNNYQTRVSTLGSTSNTTKHQAEHDSDVWYDIQTLFLPARTRTVDSSFTYSSASSNAQAVTTDGTSIWAADGAKLVRFNMSGVEQESTVIRPAGVAGNYGGLEFVAPYIYATVLDTSSDPTETYVIRYSSSSLATTPTLVADISSDIEGNGTRGGNGIANHTASGNWLIGQTAGSGSLNFSQNFYVYSSDWTLLAVIDSVSWIDYGCQGAIFIGDQLITNNHDGLMLTHTYNQFTNTLTLVDADNGPSNNGQGVAWDSANSRFYFVSRVSASVYDIQFVTFSLSGDSRIVSWTSPDGSSYGVQSLDFAPKTQNLFGVGSFRDQRFSDLRVSKRAEFEPVTEVKSNV